VNHFSQILYEKDGGKARVTLNRPDVYNALNFRLQEELAEAVWDADNDTSIHVVILRGAGRGFSSGYDLSGSRTDGGDELRGSKLIDDDIWYLEREQRARMAIFDLHKPVIAQVHGHCIAGGSDLALLCDIVIAADDAVIGFPVVRAMGSPPAHMLTYLAGPQWAKRLLLTGDSLTGAEAAEIGLVLRSVPLADLGPAVEALADRMCRIDVQLLAANKRACNLALELMGARTMQRLAAEIDARAHQAPANREFRDRARSDGLKPAVAWRDGGFPEASPLHD
jgi:enoyl-CoA hydratase